MGFYSMLFPNCWYIIHIVPVHPAKRGSIMKKNYRKTLLACYLGSITPAITAKFAPLLF